MSKYCAKNKSQAVMEYFIILAAVVSLTLLGLGSKAGDKFLKKVKDSATSYFNQTAEGIINANSGVKGGEK